ncbi:MAG: SRPBCC family protein, partial [Anaerolineaceae bacterium]
MATDKPNITIENSIFIARPTEDIWNFLSDIVNDQQWRKGLIDTRWTYGEPSTLGSTAVYIFEGIGEVHWKLTEWEDQRVIGWDYIGGRLDGGHGSYRMEPE